MVKKKYLAHIEVATILEYVLKSKDILVNKDKLSNNQFDDLSQTLMEYLLSTKNLQTNLEIINFKNMTLEYLQFYEIIKNYEKILELNTHFILEIMENFNFYKNNVSIKKIINEHQEFVFMTFFNNENNKKIVQSETLKIENLFETFEEYTSLIYTLLLSCEMNIEEKEKILYKK